MNLSVREMGEKDISLVVNYFVQATPEYLRGMGVEKTKLPKKEAWIKLLAEDLVKDKREKEFFYIIWQTDGVPMGHSNINKIVYGQEAYMHLHLWNSEKRQKGMGVNLLKQTIPLYFHEFELKQLFCEPNAYNPAPNHTLRKIGFEFLKEYETIPGWINFHQPVCRYVLTRERLPEVLGAV